ncbi:MAG TPA: hypothetical protein VK809_08330, partial [Bacteroidia bacterium]|nr:hypothetical protein [Bacteroidia bacterium]
MRNFSVLKQFFLFSFLASAPVIYAQNVGINTSGSTPSVNAILDLNTGNTGRNMGLIIPHVALTTTLTQFSPPIVSAASILDTGMIVYNTNIAAGSGVGYYYWNGNTWVSVASAVGGGLTSANNGLSVNGTIVQLGGLTTAPAPLLQNSVISGSNFNLDFDLGTYTTPGTGSFLITNGGTANTYLSVTSTTPGVGVNINPALSTLDVNGSMATRAKYLSITANTLLATANTSYIVMTSNSTQCSSPYNILSLSNGQPGQELVLEVSSGYASLLNSGNVALAAVAVFTPYSTLSLKWDNINSVWVELARNALTLSSAPSLTSSFSWNGTTTYYTGSVQTWTVPSCATTITVTAVGGSGFSTSLGGAGGLGASLTGTVTVVPGHVLDILVGGQGTDASPANFGASGGGGTYIWDATSSTLLIVAGGGGGAGAV